MYVVADFDALGAEDPYGTPKVGSNAKPREFPFKHLMFVGHSMCIDPRPSSVNEGVHSVS
jgi:hypothetical protein